MRASSRAAGGLRRRRTDRLGVAALCVVLVALPTVAAGAAAPATPDAAAASSSGFFLAPTWDVTSTRQVAFGSTGDVPVVGDWDGDGQASVGVRRGNAYHLDSGLTGGAAAVSLTFGLVTDDVVVGDWDGDGQDTIGVRRGNLYLLRNDLDGGAAEVSVRYGRATDEVLVGDWDGDGDDTLGVRRVTTFVLSDTLGGGSGTSFSYGRAIDVAVVGNWDGRGGDSVGVRRGSAFHLRNSLSQGPADRAVSFGRSTDQAVVGDWDGDGVDTLGVRRAPAGPYRSAVRAVTGAELGGSWRPGCPVAPKDLRNVSVTHWGYDRYPRTGNLVVAASEASRIASVFGDLYAQGFPIDAMYPTALYGASDDLSMQADNTSAFLCRTVPGSTTVSQHSYGLAVDINPLVNPWVHSGQVDPPEGAPYVDRSVQAPGLIRSGDAVVRAFAARGWSWGGYWTTSKDYQHFSRSGR